MQRDRPAPGEVFDPLDRRKVVPFAAAAASDGLEWSGIQAVRYVASHEWEIDTPPLAHHTLVLFLRPPDELDLRYEGVERHTPPRAGSIALMPAGSRMQWRWRGLKESLHVHREPGLVERVAREEFDLDPAKATPPPLDSLNLPQMRALMRDDDAELTTGGAGGRLAAESLANVLAVHLIRLVSRPRPLTRGRDGTLPQDRLRAVVEYIEGCLDAGPTLEQMAAVARLSPYHFARQFKAATGLPPHQFVIARRVERSKRLMQEGGLSLVQIAARAGFSDQSQFTRHFKRLVGVTPKRFLSPARSDQAPQAPPRTLPMPH